MLKAIITVAYSDISGSEEPFCMEDNYLSITPLHADLGKSEACSVDCTDSLPSMIEDLVEGFNLNIEPDTLYSSIFEVKLIYSHDYYGEVDMNYELRLIDHVKIGEFDENNNLSYCEDKVESGVEVVSISKGIV